MKSIALLAALLSTAPSPALRQDGALVPPPKALIRQVRIAVEGKLVDWEMEITLGATPRTYEEDSQVEIASMLLMTIETLPWSEGGAEGVTRKVVALESDLEVARDGRPYAGDSPASTPGDCLLDEDVAFVQDTDGLLFDDQRSGLDPACEPLAETLGSDFDALGMLNTLLAEESVSASEWQAACGWVEHLSRLGRMVPVEPYGVSLPTEPQHWPSLEWRISSIEQMRKNVDGARCLQLVLELAGSGENEHVEDAGEVHIGLGYTLPGKVETSTELSIEGTCLLLWDLDDSRLLSTDLTTHCRMNITDIGVEVDSRRSSTHEGSAVWEYEVTAGFELVE